MGNVIHTKKWKERKSVSHPLLRPAERYSENVLTPVSLTGVVIPWEKGLNGGRNSDYKLVCSSGLEYFIVADREWKEVLSFYRWEEVKVIGLLNVSNMTIIPQKVFPKGPTGEKENMIHLARWKGSEFVKKIAKNLNDLVLVPAAICAVMS